MRLICDYTFLAMNTSDWELNSGLAPKKFNVGLVQNKKQWK